MRIILLATLLLATPAVAQPLLDKIPDRHPAYANDPAPTLVRTIPIAPVHTFEQRWEPARRLIEEQASRAALTQQTAPAAGSVDPPPIPRPRVRPGTRVADLCQRHGKTKVFTGKYQWRCK